MIVWTQAVLGVLYACVLYFRICPCSAQLSVFHMEWRCRNTFIIIMIISVGDQEKSNLHVQLYTD